jgi:hypothetical protein
MHPIHDVDIALLLSLAVAAKRRPAELVEVITALDLVQGAIPSERKLCDAFARMSTSGLIVAADGGYTLPPHAQQLMATQRKNDDAAQKAARLKEQLAGYRVEGEHAAIKIDPEQLRVAILAFRTAKSANRSWGVEKKPKPVWIPKKELVHGGKTLPRAKRRKD